MTMQRRFVLAALATAGFVAPARAQSSLVCPQTTSDTTFSGTTLQTDCSNTVTTGCTAKSGVNYDPASTSLKLPATAGAFQAPANAAVDENVLFAATADFDRDGWEDIAAADEFDKIYFLRNQTLTCGKSSCTGSSTVAPVRCDVTSAGCTSTNVLTTSDSWWNTLTNKRPAAFRNITTTLGVQRPIKPEATGTLSNPWTPMVAGDFNGDGWPDFIALSYTHSTGSFPRPKYATAARLFLNTKNCRLTASNAPCGYGMLCTGQPANGACTGNASLTSGTPFNQTDLSCTIGGAAPRCPNFHPTFAVYDVRNGNAVSANNAFTVHPVTPTPVTFKPGDFGPVSRPTTQMQVLDWDGDGDLDFLFGHGPNEAIANSTYACPAALCTVANKVFYAGVDVWLNNCAQAATWNPTTKSCPNHIPSFSHAADTGCTASTCANADTLFPSTAHNTTTVTPSSNMGFDYGTTSTTTTHKVPVFAYEDIDNDNDRDLVIGSVGCCSSSSNSHYKLRIYKNTSGSKYTHTLDTANPVILSTSSSTYPGFEGALTAVFVYDFSLDGFPDIVTGTDALSYNNTIGGRTRYWANSGNALTPFGQAWPTCSSTPSTCAGCSASCNPSPTTIISQSCGSSTCIANPSATPYPLFADFDAGLMLNYDNDPSNTKDIVMTNSASVGQEFYIFPNRAQGASVDACGTAVSGTLPQPTGEATVTGACITPSAAFGNSTSSVRYYLSNENPEAWQLACTQTTSGMSPNPCCVAFTNVTGNTIKWKAVLDSNSADDGTADPCSLAGASSPAVLSVAANYTYNEVEQHFRAGVVVSDGVSYVGSFAQPGNRGHFYGLAAGDGTKYFDTATKLQSQSSRNVFTSDNVGTSLTAIAFSPVSPSTTLTARVGASNSAEATSIINWVLDSRFGVTNPQKLGAVLSSTPAILTPPFRPAWYTYLSPTDKATYDAFATTYASRVPLALFGAMDGMLHAVISIATDISNSVNGTEAWAFVPPYVASNMKADYIASCASGCSPLTTTVTAYPDGSPTLVDFKKANGTVATVALVGDGGGGSSITVLDVTNTVDSTFAVTAPDPLWSVSPGDPDAGHATAKTAVARVKLNGTGAETFVVVAGTGLNSADPTKGKVVAGYNLETGALLWKFEMQCPLTSDIAVFETDDVGEDGNPTIDGYIDRAVFADDCGFVYKINPSFDRSGAGYWLGNQNYGNIVLPDSNGVERRALFAMGHDIDGDGTIESGDNGDVPNNTAEATDNTLGERRPIVGTIGARADGNTDMILFFGTGGQESFDPTKVNEFYAVRARDGAVRNKITGACPTTCEKFYGGVVITTDTVIVQRSVDPEIGGGSCDYGTTKIQFLDLTTLNQTDLVDQIGGAAIAASSGPLFGDANALYFATVSGEIKRIGDARADVAGADSSSGNMQRSTNTVPSYDVPFTLIGWRVVL